MKLKQAYGHPSYNKLIKAFHELRQSEIQKVLLIRKMFGWLLLQKTDCEKCRGVWK